MDEFLNDDLDAMGVSDLLSELDVPVLLPAEELDFSDEA